MSSSYQEPTVFRDTTVDPHRNGVETLLHRGEEIGVPEPLLRRDRCAGDVGRSPDQRTDGKGRDRNAVVRLGSRRVVVFDETLMTSSRAFQRLVSDALDSLPEDIAHAMENVEVVVEDEPPAEALQALPEGETVLGLYHGIPLPERASDYGGVLPDKVSIYRGPIERLSRTREEVRDQVRRTLIHEIAHHFGIDDARLAELEWD
jgi:predicted Zn-dependent protease with MMP-like domain